MGLFLRVSFAIALVVPLPARLALAQRTNFVIFIADDLGYAEAGPEGRRDISTPAIDALAADGVRCTAGYVSSSYCSPSRAGLFTGRYQSRFGYDQNPTGKKNLNPAAGLPETETTFVTRLQDAGYATSLVGKWHLGTSKNKVPTARGFDEFFGFLHEGHSYVPGPPFNEVLSMFRDKSLADGERVREGNVIRGNYAPINEPDYDADNPLLKSDDDGELSPVEVATYFTDAITHEAVDFIERKHDEPFCLVVSYSAVHSPMQALLRDLAKTPGIEDDQRRIFAGMLVAMDRSIGGVRNALIEHELASSTMVAFVSDNGGPTRELTSSNAPLRGEKGSLYEGGVRVPMIWSYPGEFPEGVVEDRVVLSLDIGATALDYAGVSIPDNFDGKSVRGFFDSADRSPLHDRVYWRMQRGKAAYRSGNWKIVRPKAGKPFELYHLAGDISESTNLAGEQPEQLRKLVNQWSAMESQMAD